jgi:SAM-dependent methyltransferase
MTLLPTCFCGRSDSKPDQVNGLPVLACACGAVRQDVEMTLTQYAKWYESAYHERVYYHSYGQDRLVAGLRLNSYDVPKGARLLDVGCGNNAFVDECLLRDIDAWGQDLAEQADCPRTYVGDLHAVAFPSESFDVVTCHDVLEHVPDPVAFLREIRRVLKPGGTFYLDFPRFHHAQGRHHWKLIEHLWLLDEAQLAKLLDRAGFKAQVSWNPVESKVTVAAAKTAETRVSVLVPPGIGDSYWVMTKLPGLLRREGVESADLYVHDSPPRRTHPYLTNVALGTMKGYAPVSTDHPVAKEAYQMNGRTVFPGAFGVDFFVAYNGVLRHGRSLVETDPDFGVEWRPRTFLSKEAEAARREASGIPYVVAYFVDHGMYKRWLREFNSAAIDRALVEIQRKGFRVVVVGAEWDLPSIGNTLGQRPGRVNMIGKTSFDQLYGLLSGASAVVGFPSGATLLAPTLNVPTVLLWNRFFDPRFWTNSVPPDAPYLALDTRGLSPMRVASAVLNLAGATEPAKVPA